MSAEDERHSPGTAEPAKIRKAACGIRFDDDELQEGIDFSGAADLKPAGDVPQEPAHSRRRKHRQPNSHP